MAPKPKDPEDLVELDMIPEIGGGGEPEGRSEWVIKRKGDTLVVASIPEDLCELSSIPKENPRDCSRGVLCGNGGGPLTVTFTKRIAVCLKQSDRGIVITDFAPL
jgi:hypothetical protein